MGDDEPEGEGAGEPADADPLPAEVRQSMIETLRRQYDRKYARLETLDERATQTARTAVLILGFVASGLTVAGPDGLEGTSLLVTLLGTFGVMAIAAAAVAGIAMYTVTIVPEDVAKNITTVTAIDQSAWELRTLSVVRTAIKRMDAQLRQNQRYLEYANTSLLSGVIILLLASGLLIMSRAFGAGALLRWLLVLGIIPGLSLLILISRNLMRE